MRIALTVDPEIPVPPVQYGGIERVVDLLIRGLVKKGHQVTLFANPDSRVECEVVPYLCSRSNGWNNTLGNMIQVSRMATKRKFDIIHSHGRLAYLLPLMPLPIPKLMTYGRCISSRSIRWGSHFSGGTLEFTGVSRQLVQKVQHLGRCHVVYNGVDEDQFEFRRCVAPDAPLVFLGRVEWIKGPHLAIATARRSGRRLVIAGNIPDDAKHRQYFEAEIRPHIDDEQIRYIGPVDDVQKNKLLGQASALLMPILWEEPFGLVMAEALACGTPVVSMRRGAAPEVVQDGVTGFLCDDLDQMVAAIGRLGEIDRADCRRSLEEQFSGAVMVREYERVYETMLSSQRRTA